MIEIDKTILDCDVLVVGGGIAGLMAAIAAADQGIKVIVAEKCDTRRSGSGCTGNDHFMCYIPEVHGSVDDFYQTIKMSQAGRIFDKTLVMKFINRSFEVVQDWEKWGIEMRPTGKWEFLGHAFPGRMRIHLKYNGENQKAVLTQEALKRGVKIENKTAITDYLVDGGKIVGAIGLDISKMQSKMKLFRAKSVISTTGNTSRLYPSITGAWMFNTADCPSSAANGRAAAYRAGAALTNLELPTLFAGPKYFVRSGKATWIGLLKDSKGTALSPFINKPNKELGDVTADIWPGVFTDKYKDGTGPVYMDCSEIDKADMDYMMWAFKCEGITSLVDAMQKQNIDLHKHMVEFAKYEPTMFGAGIEIDENGSTSVSGLYAAGDEVGNFRTGGIPGAAVYGRIAGESAAAYTKNIELSSNIAQHPLVQKRQEFFNELLERKTGATWKELNTAVQQIMSDYASVTFVRSETLLSAGYKYLCDLEQYAYQTVKCENSHELMRALESFDLLLFGKLLCLAARERKETRGMHRRSDYTFTNPLLDGMLLTVKQGKDGEAELNWRATY